MLAQRFGLCLGLTLLLSSDGSAQHLKTELHKHSKLVWSVAFSSDGKTLASGGIDRDIHLWDVKTGKLKATLKGHRNDVLCVTFSPDGKTLASSDWGTFIKFWDLETGKETSQVFTRWPRVWSIRFSPDGKTLANVDSSRNVNLWDMQTKKLIATHNTGIEELKSVCFSPDGTFIAVAGGRYFNAGQAKVLDAKTGKTLATMDKHTGEVWDVAFSPDGKTLASVGGGKYSSRSHRYITGQILLWDVKTGKMIHSLEGHLRRIYSVQFSPDGKTLATCGYDATIRLWDLKHGHEITELRHRNLSQRVTCIRFSPDGGTLAATGEWRVVQLWDVRDRSILATIRNISTATINTVDLSPDNKLIATLSVRDQSKNSNKIILRSVEKREIIGFLKNFKNLAYCVRFSPDGKTLASGHKKGIVHIWNIRTGEKLHSFQRENGVVTLGLRYSPDGKRLVVLKVIRDIKLSPEYRTDVEILEANSGKIIGVIKGKKDRIACLQFSPNGKRLAYGVRKEIVLWDIDANKELHRMEGNTTGHLNVQAICFSSDGKTLVSAGDNGRYSYNGILFWDVNTGKRIHTLKGHKYNVASLQFSPDDNTLVVAGGKYDSPISSGEDNNITFWDLKTDKIKTVLHGHLAKITWIRLSSDGRFIVSTSKDRTLKIWDTSEWTGK